jgi:uncharacterized protein YjiS (DUF1127 family)
MRQMTNIPAQAAIGPRAQAPRSQRPYLHRAASFMRRLGERYRAVTALRHLETMSDWQLKDVGIDRCRVRHGMSLRGIWSGHAGD